MKVFIVHAHPEEKSFTTAMKTTAVEVLRRQGHDVVVSDLYAMDFDPVARASEFVERADPAYLKYALEQRHAVERGSLAPVVAAELQKLLWCDLLILSFPVYWFSVPAIMKGWIDRVLVSGVTYGGRRIYDKGGLAGKHATLSITLGGREHMFGPGAIHGNLNDLLKPLLQGTLAYVGLTVIQPLVAYHVPYIDDVARQRLLEAHALQVADVWARPALPMPSLSGFDEQMRPRGGRAHAQP